MEILQEMKQVSITELMKDHSLVVPEIQREYVWGFNDYEILDSFLQDIKKGFNNYNTSSSDENPLINLLEKASDAEKMVLLSLIEKSDSEKNNTSFLNIGFLYSYKPNYYISDEGKDAYLIDGQQRFTSLFLILFYLAIKEDKLKDFRLLYRVNENKIAFDYRVRVLTHNFVIDLISNTSKIEDLLTINEKSWFLSNYGKDTTVKAMNFAFSVINDCLKSESNGLFDYVRNYIKFWHFKTEETSQGEELYITMNSRGQQLADNETIRAMLFKSDIAKKEPLKWSKLWEEWQDLFWKKRDINENSADKGFNEFLACIAGLENYVNGSSKIYSKEDFDRFKQINSNDILINLTLPKIEKYINALKLITYNSASFKENYNYSSWVEKCLKNIWNIFNVETTNWFADLNDRNRATELNRMVYLWSTLIFTGEKDLNNTEEIFRFLRIYYLRYNNFDRSVSTIIATINDINTEGLFKSKLLTNEEIEKHNFYLSLDNQNEINLYEELVWEIEDHKYNLNGRDVGSSNITHIVNFKEINTKKDLEIIKNKLYEVFPISEKNHFTIQNVLLYYGEYWHQDTPYYYINYRFDNWRRILRDRDFDNKNTRTVFNTFFNEFIKFSGSVNDFLEMKRNTKIFSQDCDTLVEKLCWYNHYIGDKMWHQGNFISFSIQGNYNALPNYKSADKIFNDYKIFYNTKGNLKGGNPERLSNLLPKNIKSYAVTN